MPLLKVHLERWFLARWYGPGSPGLVLRALGNLHAVLAVRRRRYWLAHPERRVRSPVPVVVVGNLTAGGTGKTPLVAWLARELQATGLAVGIVSRGHGRRGSGALWVDPDMGASRTGDEPLLLARETGSPVVVSRDRSEACRTLLQSRSVDLILSDDGLQHYRMDRDMEIAVLDRARGLGNERLIPAGPLREPADRLDSVDFQVWNGGVPDGQVGLGMHLDIEVAENLVDGRRMPLTELEGTEIHAVAGIGHPERFFQSLEGHGIQVHRICPGDHGGFRIADLPRDGKPVLMTDKDAVKFSNVDDARLWRVPVRVRLPEGQRLVTAIEEQMRRSS